MRPGSRDTQPGRPTLAETVRAAVAAVDPGEHSAALADLERRFEDRDEPLTAVLPTIDRVLGEERGAVDPQREDGAVELAVAVVTYLAHRRDEAGEEREELLRLAVRAKYDGNPPEVVATWLAEEGVEL